MSGYSTVRRGVGGTAFRLIRGASGVGFDWAAAALAGRASARHISVAAIGVRWGRRGRRGGLVMRLIVPPDGRVLARYTTVGRGVHSTSGLSEDVARLSVDGVHRMRRAAV